jgi:hypothetical protein
MTKWEYQVEAVARVDDIRRVLNNLGEQGWELVQTVGTTLYFKRPKQ